MCKELGDAFNSWQWITNKHLFAVDNDLPPFRSWRKDEDWKCMCGSWMFTLFNCELGWNKRSVVLCLPVGEAMKLPMLGRLLLGQSQGCHWVVTCGIYCTQSVKKTTVIQSILSSTIKHILVCLLSFIRYQINEEQLRMSWL